MNIIDLSIRQPVATFALVILVVMFGFLGLDRLPVQLTPDVESPTITVRTTWPGATPYEVEKEIIEEQEDVLKSLDWAGNNGEFQLQQLRRYYSHV